MIRFKLASSFLMLGGLLAPAALLGQDSSQERAPARKVSTAEGSPPAGKLADQAELVGTAPAPVPSANGNDPFFNYYSLYLPGQRSPAVARNFDALETNFGLSLSDADDALRAQLEIPTGQGVVVVGVKEGSLAEQAGLKRNDVLLSLGDQAAKSGDQVKQVLLGIGKEALEVKLIREGKPRRMSLVGPQHGFPAEAAEYWIGVPVSPVDPTLRSHLPNLPVDSGLIVNDVVKGSPAEQVGVMKSDILVTMDGKPLKNSDTLIAQIQATQGKPVPLQVFRAGKPISLTIAPAKRAHPTVINYRMIQDPRLAYQVVRPNMAIEIDPTNQANQAAPSPFQGKVEDSKPTTTGSYKLYAPYSGVVMNPYLDGQNRVTNFQNWATPHLWQAPLASDPATARIEAQLKEVVGQLEEIAKSLEEIKKSTGK